MVTNGNFDGYPGQEDKVGEILDNKRASDGKLNAKADHNLTPIFLATCRGTSKLIFFLAEKGAKIEVMDLDNKTPLHFAASAGNTRVPGGIAVNDESIQEMSRHCGLS